MIEYKVQILVKVTGKPVNDQFYNKFGAKVWIGRIAKKNGYKENELMISDTIKCIRVWGQP